MISTPPTLLTLRQAAERLGISVESARKRAFRRKVLAPGVPVIQGTDSGHRFVRSTDLDALLYGTETVIPADRLVLAEEAALLLGTTEALLAIDYPALIAEQMICRVYGVEEPVVFAVFDRHAVEALRTAEATP